MIFQTDWSVARTHSVSMGLTLTLWLMYLSGCSSTPPLKIWHTEALTEEFAAGRLEDRSVSSFDDYLELEDKLFEQLDEKIYSKTETGPSHVLERYSSGSLADPRRQPINWNRSYELTSDQAAGGVLLLHGMSDSPYSLHTLGVELNRQGYHVIGLRSPGHGTAPSGLRHVKWPDMTAAVRLAMAHLFAELGSRPVHIIGYSTGATLALNYTIDELEAGELSIPASLILISPAIRVHPAGAAAGFKNSLGALPGLGNLAYLSIMDEFDPYKYNSFATNAGAQVHRLTRDVDRRVQALAQNPATVNRLPPVLVLKSTVDATVTTEAVVDNLLMQLPPGRNELILFDINRHAAVKATLLVADPGPLTNRIMADPNLPFAVTFITNESAHSTKVVARRKASYSLEKTDSEDLGVSWPRNVVSLSHVALPFSPEDPLYGHQPPAAGDMVFLGNLAFKGERGLLRIPGTWLLRQRYNPFYSYMQTRIIQWLDTANLLSGS